MFYFYDTYMNWYKWYYGDPETDANITQRVIEITDEGEVLGIGTINTTISGEQIIPTLCMSQIIPAEETPTESQEETSIEEETPIERPSLTESLKTYMIETNYRFRKKKHNR